MLDDTDGVSFAMCFFFFSHGLVGCIQYFDAIFFEHSATSIFRVAMFALQCSLVKGCLLPTWEKSVLDLSGMRQDRKYVFSLNGSYQ
jgi:hypothetical protein